MNKDKPCESNIEYSPIQGLCLLMCPLSESIMRQREDLVNKLECKVDGKCKRTPFSDPRKMVKEFCRSAAGVTIQPANVRPLYVLQKTLYYLLTEVCSTKDVSWRDIYEFVDNRLRAIRQDIIVQALAGKDVLKILVPMARYYIYANYRFCETEDANFDDYLNLKQLHEVLLSILSIHKNHEYSIECPVINIESKMKENIKNNCHNSSNVEYFDSESDNSDNEDLNSLSTLIENVQISDRESRINYANHNETNDEVGDCSYTNIRRVEETSEDDEDKANKVFLNINSAIIEESDDSTNQIFKYTELEEIQALYLLVHLGHNEALTHVLQLPTSVKNSPLVSCVLKACLAWTNGNHLPLMRLAPKMPPILACALHLHLNKVQRHALIVMSSGHSSKVHNYKVSELQQILNFNSSESLVNACYHYGLQPCEDGIQFLKGNFKLDAPVMHSDRADFVEEKLKLFEVKDLLLT